nr:MAG: hypothetical protein J07AB56_10750 [Candidatus Nanosalinarum sp. J07AB56]
MRQLKLGSKHSRRLTHQTPKMKTMRTMSLPLSRSRRSWKVHVRH